MAAKMEEFAIKMQDLFHEMPCIDQVLNNA